MEGKIVIPDSDESDKKYDVSTNIFIPRSTKEICQDYRKISCHVSFLVDFQLTHPCTHKKIFMDHATGIIFLYSVCALCHMKDLLCGVSVLCDMDSLCDMGAL